jgi:hypothetical protein
VKTTDTAEIGNTKISKAVMKAGKEVIPFTWVANARLLR